MSMALESEVEAAPESSTRGKDDWNEIKADIKEIAKVLRSLAPQPQLEQAPIKSKRVYFDVNEFWCKAEWAEDWIEDFRPTSAKLQNLVDVLLLIFIRDKDGHAMLGSTPLDKNIVAALPSFANKLMLRLSVPPKEVKPGSVPPDLAAKLREHISSPMLWSSSINVSEHQWFCEVPSGGGEVRHFAVQARDDQIRWIENESSFRSISETYDNRGWRTRKRGYGILCRMEVPLKDDGILEFRWLKYVLAQMCIFNLQAPTAAIDVRSIAAHLSAAVYFLGIFAGQWPSRNERFDFSHKSDFRRPYWFHRYYIQVHFRCFSPIQVLNERPGTDGLKCQREDIKIVSEALKVAPHLFQERRISIFGVLSTDNNDIWSATVPAFYRVLLLTEADMDFPLYIQDFEASGLKWCAGLEGTIAFHGAVFASVIPWEAEWNNVLDQIDDCLRFHLKDDLKTEKIKKWMFDDNFERSKLYFTILQVLRIFGEYIRTMSADLHQLDDLFISPPQGFPLSLMDPDELSVMRTNWEVVLKVQKAAEERLWSRVSDKTEEVKSLRDGLFNASSLREASRATTMNRYVIIFTVVTVLYLPPSFISTVFGMTIFQKDNTAETTWDYKVTTVSVSLLTYFVAVVSILAVNWEQVKRDCRKWWLRLVSYFSTAEGSAGPTQGEKTEAATDSGPEEAEAEETGNIAGSTEDPESGVVEAGQAVKHRFPWFPRPRGPSLRQVKDKEINRGLLITDKKLKA